MPKIPIDLIPKDKVKGLKPGDTIELKITSINNDTIELAYSTEDSENIIPKEKLDKMSKEELQKAPLDKLEKSLPKAERE